MKRRTFLSLMGAAALTSSMMLTGCGAGSGDDRKIVRIGHVQSQTHPDHLGLEAFANYINEKLGDKYRVEVYPSELLGSDSLPSEIRFRQAYTLSFYLLVMGRVSPVPNHTFHTYRFLYTERFFRAAFQFLHTFHGFRPYTQGSTSLCSPIRDLFSDTAEFT